MLKKTLEISFLNFLCQYSEFRITRKLKLFFFLNDDDFAKFWDIAI